jgi:hypothetical protein
MQYANTRGVGDPEWLILDPTYATTPASAQIQLRSQLKKA